MPVVTVTTCVYNGARYVRSAVDSILNQTLSDFELVVVDDGSTDETPDILACYDDPRIRLLRNHKTIGLTRSLNRAWQAGTAPYIANLDADDNACPQRLERQVTYLEYHPGVGLVGSDNEEIDEEGNYIRIQRYFSDHERLCAKLITHCTVNHSSLMYRRSLMEELGGYDETFYFAQDFDLQWRLSRLARFECLPEVLIQYRSGYDNSITKSRAFEQRSYGRQIAIRNLLDFMDDDATFNKELATIFFDMLTEQVKDWKIGDALRLKPLYRKLLCNKAYQEVWAPRLICSSNNLAYQAPTDAYHLRLIIAQYASYGYFPFLIATWFKSLLTGRQRKVMRRVASFLRLV